ncbi:MAG TPA: DUF1667 domain-containing protein [Thermoplasmata archaeon]|nr:DUF1667 domain-containing protein [Thermoplasmata archaeon]
MKKIRITCIVCPIGCKIVANKKGDKIEIIEGNKCKRGEKYATDEILHPKRMVTTSVFVKNGEYPLVSVKTSQPVPKEKVMEIVKEMKRISLEAPVKCGDIIVKNVAGTDVDIIATRTVNSIPNSI